MRTRFLTLALAAALAACGTAPEPQAPQGDDETGEAAQPLAYTLPASADLSVPPPSTVFFDPSWRESQATALYEGAAVTLFAAPERFPTCGAEGRVIASVRPEGGKVVEVELADRSSGWPAGTVKLPEDVSTVEIWLRSERADGCVEYDSDFGANYRFPVHAWQTTQVHFRADWSEAADAPLKAGAVLLVDYDLARLPACRGSYRGIPMWDVVVHARFDDGTLMSASAPHWIAEYGVRRGWEPGLAVLPIPAAATSVELWFENYQDTPYPKPEGCPAWDSDFGKNYRFAIGR